MTQEYIPMFKSGTGTRIDPPEVNFEAKVFCFGCSDLMIADWRYGWECLSCDGSLMFEDDEHWHWRESGFYKTEEFDEWKGEVSDEADSNDHSYR